MSRSKTPTTQSQRKSPTPTAGGQRARAARGNARRKKPPTLARAAKAVASFLTDPDYPHKAATKGSRHRGELIA